MGNVSPDSGIESCNEFRKHIFMLKADIALDNDMLTSLSSGIEISLSITSEDAQSVLKSYVDSNTEWIEFRRCLKGTFHKIFFFKDIKDNAYVLRVSRLSSHFVDWNLYCEKLLFSHLKSVGVRTPEVFVTDCSRVFFPFDLQLISLASGSPLSVFDDDDEQISCYFLGLASNMAKYHQISGIGFGPIKIHLDSINAASPLIGLHSNWTSYINCMLEKHISHCLDSSLISMSESLEIKKYFDTFSLLFKDFTPSLLHSDLGNHNCFVVEPNIFTIIDWEDALLGDSIFDIAMWATFHPERRWKSFIREYYKSANELGPIKTFTTRQSWVFWLYYLRISLFKAVHRSRFGIKDNPNRPKPSLRIQRAILALRLNESFPFK